MKNILSVAALLAGSVQAQAEDWRYTVAPYLWVPNFEVNSEGATDSPPGDGILDYRSETSLEAAFLLYTAAQRDRHVVSFEFDWIDANTDAKTRYPGLPKADLDWELLVYTLGYSYELLRGKSVTDGLYLGIGARYYDVDATLSLQTGVGRAAINDTESWTDGFVELRGQQPLGTAGKWYMEAAAQAGTGGSDSMLDLGAHLGYRWTPGFATTLGYRYLDVELDELSLTQEGLLLSLTWTL